MFFVSLFFSLKLALIYLNLLFLTYSKKRKTPHSFITMRHYRILSTLYITNILPRRHRHFLEHAKFVSMSLKHTHNIISVSYTHLDVYKRQIFIHVPPYIALLSSTTATFLPSLANVAANVFPAFPKPITNKSYFLAMDAIFSKV